jgi:glycine/D-amino acid oxidase-like deaminating enzyme
LWREIERRTGRVIYHETGALHLVTRWADAEFERASLEWLSAGGWPVQGVDSKEAQRRLKWFECRDLEGGFVDLWAGWLDPLQALPALLELAQDSGAEVRQRAPIAELSDLKADTVLVCAGAWLRKLLPGLALDVQTPRQHEAFLRPVDPAPFQSEVPAPFWSLDLATAGWYGFPWHPTGVVKISCHVPDVTGDPDGPRDPDPAQAARIRRFTADRVPALKDAVDEGRTCFYTMSPDGHFVFDAVPGCEGVFVAGCGSGHAFKFGPVLGEWASDLLEGRPVPPAFRLRSRLGARVV